MHINGIDLNLLKLFDAIYRSGSVSRAANTLDLTQPAVSQGLGRLRVILQDPLFQRAPGGVAPTPRAKRLAPAIAQALLMLESALGESANFDPLDSRRTFRIHMSDIGEARFLPDLMRALRKEAPSLRVETIPIPVGEISDALNAGRIDLAVGFLPTIRQTEKRELLRDRYVVVVRAGHPLARSLPSGATEILQALKSLEFVNVRTHADTLSILQRLQLEDRLRLTTEHFMVLPAIVRATNLAVVMPRAIAENFPAGGLAILEPPIPGRDFIVSLHWSRRYTDDAGIQWLRDLVEQVIQVSQ